MYSSGNPTNIANPIRVASAQVDIKAIGRRLTLYQTTLYEKLNWDEVEVEVKGNFILDPQGFLNTYDKNDIQIICCQVDASSLWLVSREILLRFIKSLELDMDITFTWVLTRDMPKGKDVVRYKILVEKPDLPKQSDAQVVLNGSAGSFQVLNVFPRYF